MRLSGLLVILGALPAAACLQGAPDGGYEVAVMVLPEGRPEAGRSTFVSLGCVACHRVAWEDDLPTPTSRTPGPELGLDASQLGPGEIASSIIAPNHRVAPKYRQTAADDSSPMPNFAATMTIEQLADLVAYLRRQGAETQAKIGGGAPG